MPSSDKNSFLRHLRTGAISALGVLLAAYLLEGIHYESTGTLVLVVLVLGLFNALVRPLLILFALPFVLLTLGLGIWLINALVLYWTGALVPGFEVATYWTALWGAAIISLTGMLASALFGDSTVTVHRGGPPRGPRRGPPRGGGDVIDV